MSAIPAKSKPILPLVVASCVFAVLGECLILYAMMQSYYAMKADRTYDGVNDLISVRFLFAIALCALAAAFGVIALLRMNSRPHAGRVYAWLGIVLGSGPFATFLYSYSDDRVMTDLGLLALVGVCIYEYRVRKACGNAAAGAREGVTTDC